MRRPDIHKFLVFFACFSLLGCESSSDGLGDPDELLNFECDGFFESGDYSSVCFVEGMTPVFTQDPPIESACIFRVGDRPDAAGDEISVLVNKTNMVSVDIVIQVFAGLKQDAEEDIDATVTDISGVGDQAYIVDIENDLGSFVILDKELHVRYRNLILSFSTGYDTVNQPSCSHTNSELEKFAKIVIENIERQRQ